MPHGLLEMCPKLTSLATFAKCIVYILNHGVRRKTKCCLSCTSLKQNRKENYQKSVSSLPQESLIKRHGFRRHHTSVIWIAFRWNYATTFCIVCPHPSRLGGINYVFGRRGWRRFFLAVILGTGGIGDVRGGKFASGAETWVERLGGSFFLGCKNLTTPMHP